MRIKRRNRFKSQHNLTCLAKTTSELIDHILKNYGVSRENIIVHIQNDIITIEWSPPEKEEYFDAEFQRSLCLLTEGKLEGARFILEDLSFR